MHMGTSRRPTTPKRTNNTPIHSIRKRRNNNTTRSMFRTTNNKHDMDRPTKKHKHNNNQHNTRRIRTK